MVHSEAEAKIALLMTLRRSGITSSPVLSALESVPREKFVPKNFQPYAYENRPLPIGDNQTISQPLIVGLMTQALELTPRLRVLEIGTGSGYQAAILARLSRRVYTVERLEDLYKLAQKRFEDLDISNISTRLGDGGKGWAEAAPFDRIIVTAAAARFPTLLWEQLAEGGIMVAPVDDPEMPGVQILKKYVKTDGECFAKDLLSVRFVPLISAAV